MMSCMISHPISYMILIESHPISYTISFPIIFDIVLFLLQDCVCLVAPYPFRSEPIDEFNVTRDFDITGAGDVWYARPQLFFKCTLCPTGEMDDPGKWRYGRTFPREVSVADAVAMRKWKERVQECRLRAAVTLERRRAQALARAAGAH